jgi:hypothetical protein
MTLRNQLQQLTDQAQAERIRIDDEAWLEREQLGINLILILQGQLWEGTQPSQRDVDQRRDALFYRMRNRQ